MLFAASESAVTKKPRLRLTMRRSSSVRPFGSFQVAMSRDMFTSCGIQWFAQVARYFSHAHLYLNGTSWLTSVLPLMTRLSATLMRRGCWSASAAGTGPRAAGCNPGAGVPVMVCCSPNCSIFSLLYWLCGWTLSGSAGVLFVGVVGEVAIGTD